MIKAGMFEIVLGCASLNHGAPSEVEVVGMWFLWILCAIAFIAAVVTALKRKKQSSSYSADIILACFSPVLYWILFAFGGVSHPA